VTLALTCFGAVIALVVTMLILFLIGYGTEGSSPPGSLLVVLAVFLGALVLAFVAAALAGKRPSRAALVALASVAVGLACGLLTGNGRALALFWALPSIPLVGGAIAGLVPKPSESTRRRQPGTLWASPTLWAVGGGIIGLIAALLARLHTVGFFWDLDLWPLLPFLGPWTVTMCGALVTVRWRLLGSTVAAAGLLGWLLSTVLLFPRGPAFIVWAIAAVLVSVGTVLALVEGRRDAHRPDVDGSADGGRPVTVSRV